ncbi:MAG: hypothetical protein MK329_09930 [Pirellulales bacterium]|nr:hypothetical protein [Pirellulales bacterium]
MEKWLILGWSGTIEQIVQAVASSPVREIIGVVAGKQALDPSYPVVDFNGLPETILLEHKPDVVICGPHETFDFAPLARIAVQSETTLIVEHGNFDSIVCFELEMLRHEATGIIQSVFPFSDTLAFSEFSKLVQGQYITHLSIEEKSEGTFTIDEAVQKFANIHPAVTSLQGPSVQINAVATEDAADGYFRTILVTVTNESGSIATWCLTPSSSTASVEFTVKTPNKSHVLYSNTNTTTIDDIEIEDSTSLEQSVLNRLLNPSSKENTHPSWSRSAKTMDTAETIPVSIRRKRNIPIHGELPTEHDTFKGVMSMVGCFTLLLILGIIFIFVLVDVYYLPSYRQEASELMTDQSHMTPANRTPFFLRIWPVYPLVVLLLMQFLRRCIRPRD